MALVRILFHVLQKAVVAEGIAIAHTDNAGFALTVDTDFVHLSLWLMLSGNLLITSERRYTGKRPCSHRTPARLHSFPANARCDTQQHS
jgi:hypothetical protein